MEQLFHMMKDYWVFIILAIMALLAGQFLLRSLIRVIMLFVVCGVVMVIVFQYTPDQVIQMGRDVYSQTNEIYQKTIAPMLEAELQEADYTFHDDGIYEIRTASVRIVGKKGDDKATIYYKDTHFEINLGQLNKVIQSRLEKEGSL